MSASRASAGAVEQLRQQLSGRDQAVLQTVKNYRLLQVSHVQRLHFFDHGSEESARRICRRVLKRLTDQQLLVRLERRIGGQRAGSAGYIYALSPLGHRLVGTPTRRRWREPGFGFVRHTLAIAELGTALTEAAWNQPLTSWHLQTEPAAWRTFTGGVSQSILKPDLAVALTSAEYDLRWFIEVDLGTESRPTIERKCQTYTEYWRSGTEQAVHGLFPRTLWVAPGQQRAAQLQRAIDSGARIEPRLFSVTTKDQAIAVLTDFSEDPP